MMKNLVWVPTTKTYYQTITKFNPLTFKMETKVRKIKMKYYTLCSAK